MMKNIFSALVLLLVFNSCSKQVFTDATDTFKQADSLFTKANDGLKTLDSISKRVNDSSGVARKVIIPQIEKQTKRIDSTLRSGSWKIDSINKDIAEITKKVKIGTDVAKTLDSANQLLKKGENTISVLAKTADKILRRTQTQKTEAEKNKVEEQTTDRDVTVVVPPKVEKNPISKTAILEIEVDDLSNAKSLLRQKMREGNAEIVSENFSQKEGFQREYITVKVPLYNFDNLVANLSTQLGQVTSKSTDSQGRDYLDAQMCDIEITLVQNDKMANSNTGIIDDRKTDDSFGDKSSSAFMSGFKVLENIMIAIVPYWPLFLIAGLVFYFVRRNKKKKESATIANSEVINDDNNRTTTPSNQVKTTENITEEEEPDYSKYLPKK